MMDWVLRSPQLHSTFGSLGHSQPDGYHVNDNCNAVLETILQSILTEDEYLHTYRRSISFAENIEKDLIPLFVNVKEERTLELLVRILVNLTIPIECLLPVDVINRQTVFEINNLLSSAKAAFTDIKTTAALVDFIKKNQDVEEGGKLSAEQCANISNCLILLRNILHIPEEPVSGSSNPASNVSSFISTPRHSMQNQILWNIFSQSIDKVLIKLMIIPEASNWAVTMVQLIALLYKDQHVSTLHQLLNTWLDVSVSESTEDNESNTSNSGRVSENSSFLITSDVTSDSSDVGNFDYRGNQTRPDNNVQDGSNYVKDGSNVQDVSNNAQEGSNSAQYGSNVKDGSNNVRDGSYNVQQGSNNMQDGSNREQDGSNNAQDGSYNMQEGSNNAQDGANGVKDGSNNAESSIMTNNAQQLKSKPASLETFDFGYGTQVETRESISTSSNDDEYPSKKPVNPKPLHPKQKTNPKNWPVVTIHDIKRKKLVKRGKSNIYNTTLQELQHKIPSDDDISNILKEFTVDFLLKGYNSLVETLYNRILLDTTLEIDTSHFFWLLTYFLKFATQIELDLEHISSVLSFEIVSYLTAEGVNTCEQFELAIKLDKNGLKPILRRLHLIVTAIRQVVLAIQAYENFSHICDKSKDFLKSVADRVCQTEELRNLFVLLLQYYNKKYHTKQYLVDLIVTNHVLLSFLDRVTKSSTNNEKNLQLMADHMKQFAATEIMQQYGTLLEEYLDNGEYVNDCVFTLMHHVGGELESLISLFQPRILTTFTSIWKSDFYVCDDWSDLIEYVINTFIKKPETLQSMSHIRLESELDFTDKPTMETEDCEETSGEPLGKEKTNDLNTDPERWTEKEILFLTWNFKQYSGSPDITEITQQLNDNDICKTRMAVISELYRQNLINQDQYKDFTRGENLNKPKKVHMTKEMRDAEIRRLCDLLRQDGKSKSLDWLQNVLLELCFAKICFEKNARSVPSTRLFNPRRGNDSELFKDNTNDLPVMSSVAWLALLHNQSVALVPWNCEQSAICKDLRFLQLIHKFGFCMPVDTEKVFIRIPNIWTTELLFDMARSLSPIDTTKLKFSLDDICGSADFVSQMSQDPHNIFLTPSLDNYQNRKSKHTTSVRNSTTTVGSYSTGIADPTSWLDIVKNSQNGKLFDLGSGESVLKDVNLDLDLPESAACFVRPDALPPCSYPDDGADTDYSNSICDTVSVASNLTRMYVSDEDEKPEPCVPRGCIMRADTIHDTITDGMRGEKRHHNMHFAVPHMYIGKKMCTNSQ